MNITENTPKPMPATEQGNSQSNDSREGLTSNNRTQQGDNTDVPPQADQANAYRGQGGQEYDVDADDAINHQADYLGNDAPEIETVTPDSESAKVEAEQDKEADKDTDIESQRDSDQNINPGDKAPNRDFNR